MAMLPADVLTVSHRTTALLGQSTTNLQGLKNVVMELVPLAVQMEFSCK